MASAFVIVIDVFTRFVLFTIHPPKTKIMLDDTAPKLLRFINSHVTWFRPVTLQELLDLKAANPESKMVVGNTEVGVEVKFKNQKYPTLIDLNHIPELASMDTTPTGIRVGASVTLTSIEEYLKTIIQRLPEHKTRVYAALVEMLRWFGGQQIRNVASLGGNIATGSPISDLNPLLMAAQCKVELLSKRGLHTVTVDESFFTDYRKTIIKKDEVILAVCIPFTTENEYMFGYKQSQRREDDIAIVNAGMRVVMKPGTNMIRDCTLAFGGMAATTVLAKNTMKSIKGRQWNEDLMESVCPLLISDLPLAPGAPGGMEAYRQVLVLGFFFKFYLTVLEQIKLKLPGLNIPSVPASYKSANQVHQKTSAGGVQIYQEVPSGQPIADAVGQPLTHQSAFKQATGEAVYVDDLPTCSGEMYLGLVLSQKAHANIISVDTQAALAMEGVHSYVDVNDVPGTNLVQVTTERDDPLFADKEVTCVGQAIGVIVADNQAIAQAAAKLVKVHYEELPPIITIQDAIANNSFYPGNLCMKKGNIDEGFQSSDHILEGEVNIGGQEHFYLETFSTLVIPRDGDEIEVTLSTQWPPLAQNMIAEALGVPSNKVVCQVKRMGGAFGGKSSRPCIHAAMCAVAANKVNRPVRLVLDRDEDMTMTGIRHPFLCRYRVGFTRNGQLRALQADLFCNGGNTMDVSGAIMEKAMLGIDNCYNYPNVKVEGHLCKTNIPSNSAFRGFGTPQGNLIADIIQFRIAETCGLSNVQTRKMNFYVEGDETPYGMELEKCNIALCWDECLSKSDFHQRRRDVDQFNSENRWRKRGIAIIPAKFGIGFEVIFLNQAGALVHIYTDGTVLIAHGGTEMGQGLHTKMIQVASRTLRIPPDKIHISETSTNAVPNTSPTSASTGSDLNGMAVKNACETILHRLEPFIQENPKGSWESWVMEAYLNRVSLSSTGFYKTPNMHFNFDTFEGRPFNYFVYGAAVSEVEIDCLTGDHRLLRTDIVMDVGDSLNPAVDIGQIEGAFIQGYGLFLMEDYRMTPSGHLLTKGPGMYKIPGFGDIPAKFNVSLLGKAPNPLAVYSSKGIGEPSLSLASSIFFAVKDAIQSAREDAGLPGPFHIDSPATAERIRMACQDQFTKQCTAPEPGSYTPFFIRP